MNILDFKDAKREQLSLLAGVERRALTWAVQRIPLCITSDHLTLLGFAAMALAGLFYALSRESPSFLHAVNLCIAVNWLGDSLDGSLARYRNQQRPRYGFYVDHMTDTFSVVFIIGGLILSGYMTRGVALTSLIVYLMLTINVYLATYTMGKFQLSFCKLSPTELRVILSIGNLALLYRPWVKLLGHNYLLYDVGGVVATVVMSSILIVSAVYNGRTLLRQETHPYPRCLASNDERFPLGKGGTSGGF